MLRLVRMIADEMAVSARMATQPATRPRRLSRAPSASEPVHPAERLVAQMLDYAQHRYHLPIRLDDVAAALGRSPSYLCDLFSKTVGRTFHHYLDDLRLARAKELLADPRPSICEVAYAVGYTDANYFRQAFKAHIGSAPSIWRQGLAPASRHLPEARLEQNGLDQAHSPPR